MRAGGCEAEEGEAVRERREEGLSLLVVIFRFYPVVELLDGAEQFVEVERLGKEGIGAIGDNAVPLGRCVEAGDGDDKGLAVLGILFDAAAEGMAVYAGDVDIEEDKAGLFVGDKPARLKAIVGLKHGKGRQPLFDIAGEEVVELEIVVDDKDAVPDYIVFEMFLKLGRNTHAALLEKGEKIFGIDPVLPAGRCESFQVTIADPVDRCLIDDATEIGHFES